MPRASRPSRARKSPRYTGKRNPPPEYLPTIDPRSRFRVTLAPLPLGERNRLGQCPPSLADPPDPIGRPRSRRAEPVPEVQEPHVLRRRSRERIPTHQGQHLGTALQEASQ